MFARQVLKAKIITRHSQYNIKHILVSPQTGKVLAFQTESDTIFPWLNLVFEDNNFILKNENSLKLAEGQLIDILGFKVINLSGLVLGKLKDFEFSQLDGLIEKYLVKSDKLLIAPNLTTPRDKVIKIKIEGEIIVEDKEMAKVKTKAMTAEQAPAV